MAQSSISLYYHADHKYKLPDMFLEVNVPDLGKARVTLLLKKDTYHGLQVVLPLINHKNIPHWDAFDWTKLPFPMMAGFPPPQHEWIPDTSTRMKKPPFLRENQIRFLLALEKDVSLASDNYETLENLYRNAPEMIELHPDHVLIQRHNPRKRILVTREFRFQEGLPYVIYKNQKNVDHSKVAHWSKPNHECKIMNQPFSRGRVIEALLIMGIPPQDSWTSEPVSVLCKLLRKRFLDSSRERKIKPLLTTVFSSLKRWNAHAQFDRVIHTFGLRLPEWDVFSNHDVGKAYHVKNRSVLQEIQGLSREVFKRLDQVEKKQDEWMKLWLQESEKYLNSLPLKQQFAIRLYASEQCDTLQGAIRGQDIQHLLDDFREHMNEIKESPQRPFTKKWMSTNMPSDWLNKKEVTDQHIMKFLFDQAELIQTSIRSSPPLPEPLLVYRGMKYKHLPVSMKDVDRDTTSHQFLSYRLSGFCSASLLFEVAADKFLEGKCCVFEILLPPKTRALYIKYHDEEEVLLDMNSIFVQVEPFTKMFDPGQNTNRWMHLPTTT